VNLAAWLLRLLTWDGVLPVCIFFVPSLIELLLPNNRGAVEIASVAPPIIAFFIRFAVGRHHIAANRCSAWFRRIQYAVFGIAVVLLVFFDAVLILAHLIPGAPGPPSMEEWIALAIIASVYLTLMGTAMYPGPAKELPEVLTF